MTRTNGQLTVVVVTATVLPDSQRLPGALAEILRTHPIGRSWQLTEVVAESSPALVKKLGVSRVPTVLVYRLGKDGFELAGHKSDSADADVVYGWLCAVAAQERDKAAPTGDTAVTRTNHLYASGQGQPSPQMPAPAYAPPTYVPQPPQQYYQPQVAPVPFQVPPVVSAPAAPPTVIAPAAPSFVVQQQAPTLIMSPAPAPNIVFAPSAPAMPTITVMQPASAPVASAPTASNVPQLFLSAPAAAPAAAAPTFAMAPTAAPTFAMAPAAPTFAMAPTSMVAAAPATQPVAAAPTANIGQGPFTTTVLTTIAPSLLDNLLGAIGEHFARKRQPRLQMAPAPVAQQYAQAPVALAPAPASNYVPAGYAQAPGGQPGYLAYPASAPPAPEYGYAAQAPPSYPTPSPQGSGPSYHGYGHGAPTKSGLFHR
jgi:hypothetical protein